MELFWQKDALHRTFRAKTIVNQFLQSDNLFNTPSGVAAFACGINANGYKEWKTEAGISLKGLDSSLE